MGKKQVELHDINKFPSTWGMLLFPLSMSRLDNAQAPQEYRNYLRFFTSKILTPKVGVHFFYTEGLYMNFEERACQTKIPLSRKW